MSPWIFNEDYRNLYKGKDYALDLLYEIYNKFMKITLSLDETNLKQEEYPAVLSLNNFLTNAIKKLYASFQIVQVVELK